MVSVADLTTTLQPLLTTVADDRADFRGYSSVTPLRGH